MDQKTNTFLETEKISKLMRKYSIPCIISLLVAALYNIVDQIFFGLDGLLYSFPAADILTFLIAIVIIRQTYGDLRDDTPEETLQSAGNR